MLGDSWIPRYSMVAFTRIPYNEVIARSDRQDAVVTGVVWAGAAALLGGLAWGASKLLARGRSRL